MGMLGLLMVADATFMFGCDRIFFFFLMVADAIIWVFRLGC
jgi:hypothetical protein